MCVGEGGGRRGLITLKCDVSKLVLTVLINTGTFNIPPTILYCTMNHPH